MQRAFGVNAHTFFRGQCLAADLQPPDLETRIAILQKRLYSDGIEMLLREADYAATTAPGEADVLIVNTCGFLEAAKEESIEVLTELGEAKRAGQVLVAAGCLAQRNGEEVLNRVPTIDGLLGTRRWMDVLKLVEQIRGADSQR